MAAFTGFHLTGLVAIVCMSLWSLKELPTKTTRYGYSLSQLVAFLIAFFPIVVFSAVVACYSELLLQHSLKILECATGTQADAIR
ncbi:MAG: hypothetical protein WCH01_16565, partial [Methylococcaceae bacterium]